MHTSAHSIVFGAVVLLGGSSDSNRCADRIVASSARGHTHTTTDDGADMPTTVSQPGTGWADRAHMITMP